MINIHFNSIDPLGEFAVVIRLGQEISKEIHLKVHAVCNFLDQNPIPGMIEYVPAFTNVTIYYNADDVMQLADSNQASPFEVVRSIIVRMMEQIDMTHRERPKVVEIPVCYGGEYGIDLEYVATYNHLTPEEVIEIHSQGEYLAYMIGFAPGFPYLGGLSERIAVPRRKTPRLRIPEGTVGIAGMQTGVYPLESPGGWQLIGRTPIKLFRPNRWPPSFVQMGNIVKFKPISQHEFKRYLEGVGV